MFSVLSVGNTVGYIMLCEKRHSYHFSNCPSTCNRDLNILYWNCAEWMVSHPHCFCDLMRSCSSHGNYYSLRRTLLFEMVIQLDCCVTQATTEKFRTAAGMLRRVSFFISFSMTASAAADSRPRSQIT